MENKYLGMTVNERLYVAGLSDEFDKALEEKNVDEVIRILHEVELGEASIQPVLEELQLSDD